MVEDAAVLGKSFAPAALSAVSEIPLEDLQPSLAVLVRREVLSRSSDPRSPERGQYEFVQDLLQKVAYETLSRRDRKTKHLAVAAYLAADLGAKDDVEVLAAHYLDALRYFRQAIEFTDSPEGRAELEERAGQAAWLAGRGPQAREHLGRAIDAYRAGGLAHPAARVTARLAEVDFSEGNLGQAIERLQTSLAVLAVEQVDADVAEVSAQLDRLLFFAGRTDEAVRHLEVALAAAEALRLPATLSQALNTKSLVLGVHGRNVEGDALLSKALEVALAADLQDAALRAYFNLAERRGDIGEVDEALGLYEIGLERARRVGDRFWELSMLAGTINPLLTAGRWDEALATADEVALDEQIDTLQLVVVDLVPAATALVRRGDLEAARAYLDRLPDGGASEDVQTRAAQQAVQAALARAEGRAADALAHARCPRVPGGARPAGPAPAGRAGRVARGGVRPR